MSSNPASPNRPNRSPERIAVVIPTFNRRRMVCRAIESVLSQTRPADEVIVVDDGSSDDTADAVAQYPGVRLISQRNGGLSSARNTGIRETSCNWIASLDDDDWLGPDMLREQSRFLADDRDADVVYTATFRVDSAGRLFGRSHRGHRLPANPLAAFACESFVHPSAICIRRSTLVDSGLFDSGVRLCEDLDLWLRIAASGARFGFISRPLAYITKQAGTMSSNPLQMAQATLDVLVRRELYLQSLLRPDGREWWLAGAYYRLGRVHWDAGNLHEASLALARACELDPNHRGARLYHWAVTHPRMVGAFLAARGLKRRATGVLQRSGMVESRWGESLGIER